mmetsp:Transcript_55078/g.159489  ORF Transcript_55078/g.159489 Transcript_55078/m.159489 type:complete len:792 (-) Transcript_55078:24-2399(-)
MKLEVPVLLLGLLAVWGPASHALIPSRPEISSPDKGLVPYNAANLFFAKVSRAAPVSASASYIPSYTPSTSQEQSPGTVQDLLFFTNQERHRNGLEELRYNKELEKSAKRHAEDMAKNNYFSHDGLDGSDLKDRVADTNYKYTNIGENLFWRTPDNDPAYAVQGWMESAGHRKNILDPQFSEIGLGYAFDPTNSKHYYVQVFGRPLDMPNSVASPQDTRDIMFRSANEARQRQGLPPFARSRELDQGAQDHAEDMMREGQLSQKLKRGSYDRFFTNIGARFAARQNVNDPKGAVQGWIDKGPSADILSERFMETGIGYATDGEQHYYVQLFGTPMETGVGRRDYVGAGAAPPIGMDSPGARIPQKEKKEDKARNGDFGRMGFGQMNRERRQDVDEVDDEWNDDKKVMKYFKRRPEARRIGPSSRTTGPLRPMGGEGSEVGFNENWNKDYQGTANLRDYKLGGNQNTMRQSRALMPGGGGAPPQPKNIFRSMQEDMDPYGLWAREQNSNYGRNPGGFMGDMDMMYDPRFDQRQGMGMNNMNNGMGMNNMNNGFGNQGTGMMNNNGFGNQGMGMNNQGMMNNGGFNSQRMNNMNNGFGNRGMMNNNGYGNQGMNGQFNNNQMGMQQGMNNGFGNQQQRMGGGFSNSRNGYGQGYSNGDNMGMSRQEGMNANNQYGNNGYGRMQGMNSGNNMMQGQQGSNGRRIRRATPSPFGKVPQNTNQRTGFSDSVNNIHYRRFERQMMGDGMMFDGPGGMGEFGGRFGYNGPMAEPRGGPGGPYDFGMMDFGYGRRRFGP